MKNLLIIPNATKDKDFSVTNSVARKFVSLGLCVYIEEKYGTDLGKNAKRVPAIPKDTDLIVVIGGDGSVIDASVAAIEANIPIIGVNLGNMGYLASIEPDEIDLFENLKSNRFKIEEKMLLSVSKRSGEKELLATRYAVNDIIITNGTVPGLSSLTLTNSYNESVKYRADGMILSTPVGSTAYSLSAGGPIVSHDIDCILATPICAHNFFNRSIIFKDTEKICLCNTGKSDLKISIDGRFFSDLAIGESCTVFAAEKKLKMLTFSESNMFSAIFGKMKRFENI